MSEVGGRIWVDPEGVSGLGDRYADHAATWDQHLQRLRALRVQYKDAWGDDDMGREFSQKFLSGLDNLENLVGGVKGTLEYTAEGLRSSGKAYRDADDDAYAAGHKMARDFSNFTTTGGGGGGGAGGDGGGSGSGGGPSGSHHELLASTPGKPLEPTTPAEPASGSVAEPGTLLKPLAGTPLAPMTGRLTAATPAISSYVERPEYRTALVGGQALPEGFRLQALNPMPDGTTRIDANLYDSASPVIYTSVTTPDGTPIDPDGRQFFVVKDNPHADPLADGYRPMFVSYTADGSATPL